MRWTWDEIDSLKKQIEAGVDVSEVKIYGRTSRSIQYMYYSLGFKMMLWKDEEMESLKAQLALGKHVSHVVIPNRSKIAIRNKAIRCGLWRVKPRPSRNWKMSELKVLKRLVIHFGYTAKQVYDNEYLDGRSVDSIAQQMRRMKLKRIGSKYT